MCGKASPRTMGLGSYSRFKVTMYKKKKKNQTRTARANTTRHASEQFNSEEAEENPEPLTLSCALENVRRRGERGRAAGDRKGAEDTTLASMCGFYVILLLHTLRLPSQEPRKPVFTPTLRALCTGV